MGVLQGCVLQMRQHDAVWSEELNAPWLLGERIAFHQLHVKEPCGLVCSHKPALGKAKWVCVQEQGCIWRSWNALETL